LEVVRNQSDVVGPHFHMQGCEGILKGVSGYTWYG
jgi:hypothetical protein